MAAPRHHANLERRLPSRAAWFLAALTAGLSLAASDAMAANDSPPAAASAPGGQRFTEQGIAVDFSIAPAAGVASRAPREGDDVIVRFKLSEVAGGTPVRGVQPAAWVDRLAPGAKISPQSTHAKAQAFQQSGTFSKAWADLNVYYVLVMNEDNTISVVDPLFGFGGSKLLSYVVLKSRGEDWVLSSDQRRLYVSMPESSAVAVVDTTAWSVVANIATGPRPGRLALQPDRHYLWIANLGSGSEAADNGVTVVSTEDHSIKAHIVTGQAPSEIVFSEDSRSAFVLNRGSGTLSVVDIPGLRKLSDVPVGKKPAGLDYCAKSGSVFATDEESGQIVVVDARRRALLTTTTGEPGLGQIKFPSNGQFGFIVNSKANLLHVIDSASNRIVRTGNMEKEPFQIGFSDRLAYIRDRQTATVLMIPLDGIGVPGKPLSAVDFDGGQKAPGTARYPSLAAALVQAPGSAAVLVANEQDKAVYYYEEGMAAAKGEFSNYGHYPRAVLPVDRSLRERAQPGVYETVLRLGEAGSYEVVFALSSPRILKGFQLEVAPNEELERQRKTGKLVALAGMENRVVKMGRQVGIDFKIADELSTQPKSKLQNLTVVALLAPGVWQKRLTPQETAKGIYSVAFNPPRAGIYHVQLWQGREAVPLNNDQQFIFEVVEK
jgi:DNA-binding beta-propeller fold protein YncE